ncbi:hypothetical protein QOT17_25617 [Balamuthia mandrillaris]
MTDHQVSKEEDGGVSARYDDGILLGGVLPLSRAPHNLASGGGLQPFVDADIVVEELEVQLGEAKVDLVGLLGVQLYLPYATAVVAVVAASFMVGDHPRLCRQANRSGTKI